MGEYTDVLKRLVMYRKSLGMVQTEVAEKVGIGQEMYSYIENGSVKISGQLLIKFMNIGCDMDELISGREYSYEADDLESAVNSIDTEEGRNFALKLLTEVIVNKYSKNNEKVQGETAENMLMVDALSQSWDDFSMTFFVRKKLLLSQIDMAERLGLGIKKYRAIEREKLYPDAETLFSLYDMSHYQPSLFMNLKDRKMQILKSIWGIFSASEKEKMLKYAVYSADMLN